MAASTRKMKQAQAKCAKMFFVSVKPYIHRFTSEEAKAKGHAWETRFLHFGSYKKAN